jgi:hypothetical protein
MSDLNSDLEGGEFVPQSAYCKYIPIVQMLTKAIRTVSQERMARIVPNATQQKHDFLERGIYDCWYLYCLNSKILLLTMFVRLKDICCFVLMRHNNRIRK